LARILVDPQHLAAASTSRGNESKRASSFLPGRLVVMHRSDGTAPSPLVLYCQAQKARMLRADPQRYAPPQQFPGCLQSD
jgi:hypothetical protein